MFKTITKTIVVMAILMVLASTAMGAVVTQNVEIRGEIFTGDAEYDYTNFGAFWYDLDLNRSSETMQINVTGAGDVVAGDLVYTCNPQNITYENPVLNETYGEYGIIGFLAEEYMCYDRNPSELVKLLIEWDGSDETVLEMKDSLDMPEGYKLVVQEIDLAGDKCVVTLYKDGSGIDTSVVAGGTTYTYEDEDDVLLFSCEVNSVFRGTKSNLVVIKYVFLRSGDVLDVDGGDAFGVLEVTSTSGGITLKNDDVITLDADSEMDIMDGLYIKVADSTELRYYLAKTVSMTCPDCPECPMVEPCPEQTPCPSCINATPEVVIEYVNVTVPAEPAKKNTPGFEAVFALVGLLAVACIVLRQRE